MGKNSAINAFDLKFQKLYQPYSVEQYKNEIKRNNLLQDRKNIELDITLCRLGYPSTPHFIDLFLDHLSKQDGDKTLIIKMGCISYYEWVCLNIIILEGDFFGVNEKINTSEDMDRVKKIMNKKLHECDMHMTIMLDNDEKTRFDYGK